MMDAVPRSSGGRVMNDAEKVALMAADFRRRLLDELKARLPEVPFEIQLTWELTDMTEYE